MSLGRESLPRQRLDVDERREMILCAASELFAAEGYDKVSVAQIASRAQSSTALVFHYFGSKAALYVAVLDASMLKLAEGQRSAAASLPQYASGFDKLRAALNVYLDAIAANPKSWAIPLLGGVEPEEALAARAEAYQEGVEVLYQTLKPAGSAHNDFALWGFFGFVRHACLRWVDRGCLPEERPALMDSMIGVMHGALGG